MNKIIIYIIALLVFISPTLVLANSIDVSNVSIISTSNNARDVDFFDVDIKKVVSIDGTNLTLFYFAPTDIQDNAKIANWKVRFYCDEDMSMRFIDVSKDSCNKAVSFVNSNNLPGFILFENKTPDTKQFTFALKAYDKDGKWIHTKRSNFSWK